jgi:hypothetical protein
MSMDVYGPPLDPDLEEARRAAVACAHEAEVVFHVEADATRRGFEWSPDEVQRTIDGLRRLQGQCWEKCRPLMRELQAAHNGAPVPGWGGDEASAVEVMLAFTLRVVVRLSQHTDRPFGEDVRHPAYDSLPSPRAHWFESIVTQEFALAGAERRAERRKLPPTPPADQAEPAKNGATRHLTETEQKILRLCRRVACKGESVAFRLSISYDYARRLLARLVGEGRLKKTQKGYRTV